MNEDIQPAEDRPEHEPVQDPSGDENMPTDGGTPEAEEDTEKSVD